MACGARRHECTAGDHGFGGGKGTDGGGESDARRFREALEELGPTFVKLGQMISGRTDLFPEALTSELRRLHDAAVPFAADIARRTVEEETGSAIPALFATFDDVPMAAASMAQVHCATLHDGTPVVVKVQRPGIEAMVEADIAILRRAARLLGAAVPSLRALNLPQRRRRPARRRLGSHRAQVRKTLKDRKNGA